MNRLILLLLVMLLAGCAELSFLTPPPKTADIAAWSLRQEALNRLTTWSLRGRLAVQAGAEGWSATMHWDQDVQNYTLRLIAPLGQGTYQLEGDDQIVSLLTPDNKLFQASTPERLLRENLGWEVPLHGLKYWVKGVPEPGVDSANLVLDEQGRMTGLEQSGWRINISRYSDFNGAQMPSKINMQNDRLKLRIVVQDWKTTS